MIKAAGETSTGGTLLLIGLSHENLARIESEPIGILPDELAQLTAAHGPITGIILFAGPTEADLKGWLVANRFMGPDTEEIHYGRPGAHP